MIRDAGFVLEMPDGTELEGDPLAGLELGDPIVPVGYAAMADTSRGAGQNRTDE
jgi:hypothetical protein